LIKLEWIEVDIMNKKGFAAIYLVYSFFLVFIIMMLSVLMVNTYKKNFLNALKNEIKENVKNYQLKDFITNDIENELVDTQLP